MESTSEYHNYFTHHDVKLAINEMEDKPVVAIFKGRRSKSGVQYIAFASPEAIRATNMYLLSREDDLNPDSPLFDTSQGTLRRKFKRINDQLGLGVTSKGIARFSMKELRSFHATQLEKAGMSEARINILEGRVNKSILYKHYVHVDSKDLKSEYIKCLPFLVVEDFEKIKTDLDVEKEKNNYLKSENELLKKQNEETIERLDHVETQVYNQVKKEMGGKIEKLENQNEYLRGKLSNVDDILERLTKLEEKN